MSDKASKGAPMRKYPRVNPVKSSGSMKWTNIYTWFNEAQDGG